VLHRAEFAGVPLVCGGSHSCCRPEDEARGCGGAQEQPTLQDYCTYTHGSDQTASAWVACNRVAEDLGIAAECLAAPTLPKCVAAFAKSANPLQLIHAHNDWYDVMDRNYKHHQKARDMSSRVYYNNHASKSLRYGELKSEVQLEPLKPMAPKHLIDLANGFDNTRLSDGTQAFRGWNTIGFDGGGSSIEFMTTGFECTNSDDEVASVSGGTASTCITGSEVVTAESTFRRASETTHSFNVAWESKHLMWVPFLHVDAKSSSGTTVSHSVDIVVETTIMEDSSTMFHLEDPNVGDYFVVSVWADPDYGTTLLSLDGGASSCQWEVGTAHRSAPTLAWEYVGPETVAADEPALFRVTLGNSVNYYQAGPVAKTRPGWSGTDTGYVPPDLQAMLVPGSFANGLTARFLVGGVLGTVQTFEEFGKGTLDMLVSATCGPIENTYPPFVMLWREHCANGANGENKYSEKAAPDANEPGKPGIPYYAIGMPNPNRELVFTKACPQIDWASGLKAHPYFSVRSAGAIVGSKTVDGANEVRVVTHVPAEAGGREVMNVFLDYRMVFHDGFKARWHSSTVDVSDRTVLASGANGVYTGDFAVTDTMDDGVYELRAVAECTEEASSSPHDQSSTTSIKGLVDRELPVLVSFTSSSMSDRHGAGDVFVLTFSEDVVCQGRLVDGERRTTVSMAIDFGVPAEASYTVVAEQLKYSCEGGRMTVSVPHPHTPDASAGAAIPMLSISGIVDFAGNALEAITSRPLETGRAGEERNIIASNVASVNQSLSRKIKQSNAEIMGTVALVNQSLSHEVKLSSAEIKGTIAQSNTEIESSMASVSASIKAESASIKNEVEAKVGAASNTTQDLVLNLKSDVKNQMNALNQSNTEMKGAIASLAAMVASLLRASGAATPAFPVCKDRPAMYSFARYTRGRVPPASATSAAAATSVACASKCLEVATCTAFSFGRVDGCSLATGAPSSELSADRTSQFFVRLEKCSGV